MEGKSFNFSKQPEDQAIGVAKERIGSFAEREQGPQGKENPKLPRNQGQMILTGNDSQRMMIKNKRTIRIMITAMQTKLQRDQRKIAAEERKGKNASLEMERVPQIGRES